MLRFTEAWKRSPPYRADGGVELHAIADVHLHFAFIIDPRHTESDDALGFYQAFEQRSALPLRMLVVDVGNAEEYFVNGLEILFLTGVASFELLHEKFDVHGGCSFLAWGLRCFVWALERNRGTKRRKLPIGLFNHLTAHVGLQSFGNADAFGRSGCSPAALRRYGAEPEHYH